MPTIEHVVVVVKENHTFDNYFGAFPGAQGVKLPAAADPHPDQNHDRSVRRSVGVFRFPGAAAADRPGLRSGVNASPITGPA